MTTPAASDITVRYDGPGSGAEIWGVTQANFSVHLPARHRKECAVQLTDAAARYLASELGKEDTPENRQQLATAIGTSILQQFADADAHIDSVVMVSVNLLQERPELLSELKAQGA